MPWLRSDPTIVSVAPCDCHAAKLSRGQVDVLSSHHQLLGVNDNIAVNSQPGNASIYEKTTSLSLARGDASTLPLTRVHVDA